MEEQENQNFIQRVQLRASFMDKSKNHLENLSLKSIEMKRSYLNNLLAVNFLAIAFTISIKEDIKSLGLFFGIIFYLSSGIINCFCAYQTLSREEKIINKFKNYFQRTKKEFFSAIEIGKVKNIKTLDIFEEKEREKELLFREHNLKINNSDFLFFLINLFFILGSVFVLISFITKYFNWCV